MQRPESSVVIERSIAMLSEDIDILSHTLRAERSGFARHEDVMAAMKRRRRALRSRLLFSRLLPAMDRRYSSSSS